MSTQDYSTRDTGSARGTKMPSRASHPSDAGERQDPREHRNETAPDEPRCGATGMIAYWDGSAYAGEFCPGCIDCEPPEAEDQ